MVLSSRIIIPVRIGIHDQQYPSRAVVLNLFPVRTTSANIRVSAYHIMTEH